MVRSRRAGCLLSMALAATAALAATTSDAGAGIASSFGLRISDLELRQQLIEERDAGNRHAALALDSDAGRRLLQLEDILADSPASVGFGFEGADSPEGALLPPATPLDTNTSTPDLEPAEVGFGFEDAVSPEGAPRDYVILNEGGDPRDGLRVAYYFDTALGFNFYASEWAYLAFKVFPKAANVLRRSVRVREPGGNLMLGGLADPDPHTTFYDDKLPGDPVLGINADILLKVYDGGSDCGEGTIAGAASYLGEEETLRPIFGIVQMCSLTPDGDMDKDLETIVHEIIHALAFTPLLALYWKGYETLEEIEDIVPQPGDDFGSRAILKTPNVQRVAREHFACNTMLGGETEDFGGIGSGGGGYRLSGHWDSRIYQGELMVSRTPGTDLHIDRQVLTDLTFAALQDSGWYDVKYGSSGFNPYGYKAGCGFAEADFATALLSPTAEQYLCNPTDNVLVKCNFEHSAPGFCWADPTQNGFVQATSYLPNLFSGIEETSEVSGCQPRDGPFGERCIQPKGELPLCVPMSCSADGQVTVLGSPCDPEALECPDNEFMCSDPGPLTCQGELNDCNARGDCYQGSCYCHVGWGGADCSVPTCISNEGCPDGSKCPLSGFCGVPECGTWTSGELGLGVPCNGAIGPAPTATPLVPLRGPQMPANMTYIEMYVGYDYDYSSIFGDYAPGPSGSFSFDYDYATAPAFSFDYDYATAPV